MKMKKLKLFMILLGFKPKGYNTEQHDILFGVGESFNDPKILAAAINHLPGVGKIHIDAYVEVKHADGYDIYIMPKGEILGERKVDLFFANLGGYKNGEFKEHHKPILLVLDHGTDETLRQFALQDSFVREMDVPHAKARPHLDDEKKLGPDVDDHFRVADKLEGYEIQLLRNDHGRDSVLDPVITGYDIIPGTMPKKSAT